MQSVDSVPLVRRADKEQVCAACARARVWSGGKRGCGGVAAHTWTDRRQTHSDMRAPPPPQPTRPQHSSLEEISKPAGKRSQRRTAAASSRKLQLRKPAIVPLSGLYLFPFRSCSCACDERRKQGEPMVTCHRMRCSSRLRHVGTDLPTLLRPVVGVPNRGSVAKDASRNSIRRLFASSAHCSIRDGACVRNCLQTLRL